MAALDARARRDELRMAGTRVCLVIPPSAFLLDERVFMPLGILRVAAVLEQAGHEVELLDLSGIGNCEEAARLHARTSGAAVYGLTATTPQMPAAFRVTRALRAAAPGARVILGGPHVTLVHAACKGEKRRAAPGRAAKALRKLLAAYDCLVAGDGEAAVFRAIRPDAPRIVDADDPRSELFLTSRRLDELPLPARHLADVRSYRYDIDGAPAMSLIAQLGCPFACGFCGGRESPSLRRVRSRSAESVVREMAHLHDAHGARGFMLYDDELNVNPRMVELMDAIAAEQERRGVEWSLRGFVKAQLFTDAQAAAMRRAGFRWILTGFESGSPRILKNIDKRATREENTRCVEIARRHGLKIKALMSIGHPGESEQTVLQTGDWLLQVEPDDLDVTIITTYPGTPYYDRAVPHPGMRNVWVYTHPETGDRLYSRDVDYTAVSDYYKGDPDGGYKSYVYTDHLSARRLVSLRDRLERGTREALGIPFPRGRAARLYEHSMGQSAPL